MGRRELLRHRGLAIVLVLGVLTLLVVFATVFATVSGTERSISRNHFDGLRARSVAESGIQEAIARLSAVNPLEHTDWVYRGDMPLEKADDPSFAVKDAAGNLKKIKVDGAPWAYSGGMSGGSYSSNGDVYVLRVQDANALLNLNDGVGLGNTHSVSRNMKRMLRVLAKLRQVPECAMAKIDAVIDERPLQGYRSKYEVLAKLGYDHALFDKIKDYVTVHAWIDDKVVEPVPLSEEAASAMDPSTGKPLYPVSFYRPSKIYRYRSTPQLGSKNAVGQVINSKLLCWPLANDASTRVWGLSELNPLYIEIAARAPISVNSAPREVLIASLAGLRGFFLLEQPQNNPKRAVVNITTPGAMTLEHLGMAYVSHWTGDRLDYGPQPDDVLASLPNPDYDGLGKLYATDPIKEPVGSGTMVGGSENSAQVIADELIACRKRESCTATHQKYGTALPPGHKPFNYATASFGGPFKNWAQFHKFCDNLVKIGVIADKRPLPGVTTQVQRQIASQAIADVLKANFNPNLHLNELNPDANLALLVDKTDLMVHSTEFCFYPPGRFEIDSLGRLLRANQQGGGTSLGAAPDHTIIAEAKLSVAVKLWETQRQTVQKEFYAGELRGSNYLGAPSTAKTNSGHGLEIGPEPDNGPAPAECEFDGYVALPTVGGTGVAKAKGQPQRTLDIGSSAELGEWLRVPFQWDFDAIYHFKAIPGSPDKDFRKEAHRNSKPPSTKWVDLKEDTAFNHKDKYAPEPAPYDPVWPFNSDPGTHRLCRTFRLKDFETLVLTPYAPSDLRLDGGFSERNHAPGYVVMNDVKLKRVREKITKTTTVQDFG